MDAFSVNWNNLFFYAFPPFRLIGRCLEKLYARKIDLIYTNITDALEFLATMFDQKLSYSSINSACSTLSTILQTSSNCNYTFGEHPDVKRFMKGVYQNRPPMPRYNKTWYVNVVLQYLQGMGKATELSIKELTLKLVML